LIGGNDTDYHNDVWRSYDGSTWVKPRRISLTLTQD
jgi:hypothetical protein